MCYEQGSEPKQLSEEFIIPKNYSKQTVYVSDRSTMLSIIANTGAYNLGTGCLLPRIVGSEVASIPVKGVSGKMKIGWVKQKNAPLTPELTAYIRYIQDSLDQSITSRHVPAMTAMHSERTY